MTPHDQRLRGPARTLLVVERDIVASVRQALNHGHYSTQEAGSLDEAAEMLTWRPHLVVVDMRIPACAILDRVSDPVRHGDRLPAIALTREGDLKAKLNAFSRGADDVLSVPFVQEEFVARVLAIMRRTYRDAAVFAPVLRHGDLEIDILNRRVLAGNRRLHLTALEQSLLYLLAANAGRVLTRNEILDYLWGTDYVAESNIVDRHIRNLRAKLESLPRPRCIATVPGRGYQFIAREEAS